MKRLVLRTILLALGPMLGQAARSRPAFRAFARRHDAVVQIQLKDGSLGRWFDVRAGRIRSRAGLHPNPQVRMMFKDVDTALTMMKPNPDMGEVIHAAKNFKVMVVGPDPLCTWWMQLLNLSQTSGLKMGTAVAGGCTRYTMLTNGGPLFVHVKNGRIVRLVPIEFDAKDAPGWTITARGRRFTPRHVATVAAHALAMKSAVYSDKRILRPMKRVDFDPNGERNPQNRGKSGYVPISWDEALDIVSREILRQRRVHGPGAMTITHGSHHQWGNVGYYLSSLLRFGNLVGFTRVAANPDSWEGWYWGAMHHWG
ncbi:MAG TPA: molybdopterin-dependent oxidoreductase, partial [Burkholderiaceae bacterium]|nr:molybdopterin-dependent oxidoreductase [Burkholderiaceae bacterium]